MPKVSLNLSEAQSRKPLPDDTYPVRVAKFEGPIKGPKSRYLKCTLVLTDDAGEHAGKKRFINLPVEGAGAGIFADFISKCTGQEIDVDQLENLDIDTDDLIDAELAITTKQKEYPEGSGEMQDEIVKVLKAR